MKRLFLAVLLLLLVAVAAWLAWPRLTDAVRQRAEKAVTQALGRSAQIEQLSVSVFPVRVRLTGVVLGTRPTVMAEAGTIEVRLWAVESLTELRPVVSIRLESVDVDVQQFPHGAPASAGHQQHAGGLGLPSLRVKHLEIEQAAVHFRLKEAATRLGVARVTGQLDSRALRRRMTARLDVSGIELDRLDQQLVWAEVRLAGGADKSGVFLDNAVVTGEAVNATVTAGAGRRYAVSARMDVARLGAFLDQAVAGDAQLSGTVSGDLVNPAADVQLSVAGAAVRQHPVGYVRARVTRERDLLRVADLDITGQLGHLTGGAQLTTAGDMPLQGDLLLQGVDVETVLAAFGAQPLQFQDRLSASVAVAGTLKPLQLELNASGGVELAGAAPPREVATVAVHARAAPDVVEAQLALTQPEQNQLAANVSARSSQLQGAGVLNAPDLAALAAVLPAPVRRLGLTGEMDARATLSGSTQHPVIAATVASTGLSVMGAAVRRVSGALSIEGAKLSTAGVKIDTGAGGAELSGTLALDETAPNDWRVAIQELDTDVVTGVGHAFTTGDIPVSGGKLNGFLVGQGPWAQIHLQATLAATAIYLVGEPVERVEVNATARLPEWTLRASVTHKAGESLSLEGSGTGTARVQLAIDSTPIQVAGFRGASRRRAVGTIVLHGQISGRLLAPDGTFSVTASGLGYDGRPLGDVALHADGRQGEWRLRAGAFADALTVEATLRSSSGYPYTLAAHVRDLQLAPLLSPDESLHILTDADVSLGGSLTALARPSGTLRITRLDVRRGRYRVAAAEPIRVDAENGRFHIRSFVLVAQGTRLSVSGFVSTAGDLDLQAQGEADLVLLEFLGRPFNSARGLFTVTAHVQRAVDSGWELGGRATLREATLDLGLPVAFSDINGDFTLSGGGIRIDDFGGKTGGGSFAVGGALSLSGGPDLSWKIQEVAVSPIEGFEARLSGAGKVQGAWKALAVSGDVEVLNALYDRNLELVNLLPFFREQVTPAPRTQAPAVQVRLDLQINAPGGVYVDNNFAKAELDAKLHISGTVDKPEILGTVEFLSGEVTFRQRTFNITAGSIDFRDRLRVNPVLNITADAEIATVDASYTVTVSVTGTADNPRVQFGADDPSLSENDIVALITFGKTTAQLQREGGGVSAADALALLPAGAVTGRVGKLIGVSRFEVEAAQTRTAGGIEPRVTIGKDITDEFRVAASTSFGVDTQRMVQLEYRLTPRISLMGSWEGQTESEAGAFGGDIKFRYEFRRLPFSLLPGDSGAPAAHDAH